MPRKKTKMKRRKRYFDKKSRVAGDAHRYTHTHTHALIHKGTLMVYKRMSIPVCVRVCVYLCVCARFSSGDLLFSVPFAYVSSGACQFLPALPHSPHHIHLARSLWSPDILAEPSSIPVLAFSNVFFCPLHLPTACCCRARRRSPPPLQPSWLPSSPPCTAPCTPSSAARRSPPS